MATKKRAKTFKSVRNETINEITDRLENLHRKLEYYNKDANASALVWLELEINEIKRLKKI